MITANDNYEEIELTEDEYEDMLNEIYGTVEVCGMTMDAGRILREMDETAFRCGMSDEPQHWRCLGCGKEFDDEDDAADCCPIEDEEDKKDERTETETEI